MDQSHLEWRGEGKDFLFGGSAKGDRGRRRVFTKDLVMYQGPARGEGFQGRKLYKKKRVVKRQKERHITPSLKEVTNVSRGPQVRNSEGGFLHKKKSARGGTR